jgi:putative transposase
MRKSKFTEEQIVAALKLAESGAKVGEVCRKLGVSEQTFYRWKQKYSGMEVADAKRLKQLEEENRRLKKLVADQARNTSHTILSGRRSNGYDRTTAGEGAEHSRAEPGVRQVRLRCARQRLGETPLGSDGKVPAGALPYRLVKSMSVRGQVMEQVFGNGIDETTDYDDSTGLPQWISATGLHEPSTACPSASTPLLRQLTYKYDHFLNLARQEKNFYKRDAGGALIFNACAPITAAADEVYQYDELQRLTQASRSWTNMTPDTAAATPTQYAYSDLGNIT